MDYDFRVQDGPDGFQVSGREVGSTEPFSVLDYAEDVAGVAEIVATELRHRRRFASR